MLEDLDEKKLIEKIEKLSLDQLEEEFKKISQNEDLSRKQKDKLEKHGTPPLFFTEE